MNIVSKCLKNKIIRLISLLSLITLMVSVFTGCDADVKLTTGEEGINIYYINENRTGLVSKKYVLTGKDRDERIKEVIEELKKTEVNYISAVGSADITETIISNRNLNVVLTSDYDEMTTEEKIFLRTAVVLSLTEINGVDSVEFYVGTEPVKYDDGTNIGSLGASDFVDINNNDINNYITQVFTLYFSNQDGNMLRKVKVECICSNNVSIERYVVEQLIEGTTDDKCKNTLAADTRINNITTKDGVCYVDFSEAMISEQTIDEEVSIYSIVNSLSELAHITKVQISVNGSTDVKYGTIDLSKPLSRNLNIVENNIENAEEK